MGRIMRPRGTFQIDATEVVDAPDVHLRIDAACPLISEEAFFQHVGQIMGRVRRWAIDSSANQGFCEARYPNLDDYQEFVFLKSGDRVLLHSNQVGRSFTQSPCDQAATAAPEPLRTEPFLFAEGVRLSHQIDALVLEGCPEARLDHQGIAADGSCYLMQTHKSRIPTNPMGAVILGITRLVRPLMKAPAPAIDGLALKATLFARLSDEDQEFCRLHAMGLCKAKIAEALRCTTRTVDNRRSRILKHLQLDQPIDLVKLMVRMADRELVPFEV